ncbi:MAG: MFS transporter [Dehalococcoidia bacterium]|nr:MFS transporter [Dehalococcoidia bacterium]MCA9851932.1 MFS transporter [Dehalococcoidia bacterium]MCA9856016.1 MFS transporter [Dehalococcoidia bacterium]MCB9490661.1 MFS transporter [Dehalococcoidia bacterium]
MLQRFRRPFYGWWIVGAAIVLQALPSGLLQQAYGAYVVLLEREFGWSRTALSGAFSAIRMEEGLLGPLQGWMLDRFGPRAVMRVGVVIFGGGFFLFARIGSIPGFYAAFLIMAIGASMVGFLSITTAIVNWFQRKRSMAMGLALLGTAIGGYLLPLVVWGLENWGWRAVANISGAIILIVGLPVTQIVRHKPQQYGWLPDGRQPGEAIVGAPGAPSTEVEGPAFTMREALRTRAFWFISIAHTGSVLVVSVIQVHFIAYVTDDLGLTLTAASLMVTLQTTTNLVFRPIGGWLADRSSSRLVTAVAMLGHMVALLVLAFASNSVGIAAAALLNGAAWGARVPVVVSMRAEYFGSGSFGAIMGVSSLVVTSGAVVAPIAAAWAYDVLGSYTLSFVILAVLAGLGSLFLFALPKPGSGVATPELEEHPAA